MPSVTMLNRMTLTGLRILPTGPTVDSPLDLLFVVATDPSGRPERRRLLGEAGNALVELHAEAVQRPRHEVVLADGEHGVHQLMGVVALAQRRPGSVGHHAVGLQLVDGPQQRAVPIRPA